MTSRARRAGLAVVTAAATLAGSALMATAASAQTTTTPEDFAESISMEEVAAHLLAFQAIADAHDGNRASGTPGYDASGDYVQDMLEDAGYDVERQPFEYESSETVREQLLVGGGEDADEYDIIAMSYSPSGTVTAPLFALPNDPATEANESLGCNASDFPAEAEGTIVVISRGACTFRTKQQNATAAGAVGAVIHNNGPGPLNGTLGGRTEGVPVGGVTQEAGAQLRERDGEEAFLDIEVDVRENETFNLIAQTPFGDQDNVTMLGAHLDSVHDGPGINDNGTGSAAILQVARELMDVGETQNAVRFAWWGAEESGLIGSYEYVDSLSEEELAQISGYLNFDMVGSPNYIIGVYDADESTHTAPVPVPEGSEELEQVFTDYFDSIEQPWVDTEFSGRSDYQPFILADIPASGLFTGADGVKTEEEEEMFGGQAGVTYDPNYHSPGDDITNVNDEALEINTRAIAFATLTLAGVVEPTDPPAPRRLDQLALTGLDRQLFHSNTTPGGWAPRGGQLIDAPALVRGAAESFVVGLGTDNNVWIRSEQRSWARLGPTTTFCTGPSAVASGNTMTVACRGRDGALWMSQTPLPTVAGGPLPVLRGWSTLRGQLLHGAAVSVGAGGQPVYSGVGLDRSPWTRTQAGPWTRVNAGQCGAALGASEDVKVLACRDFSTGQLRTFSGGGSALLGGRILGRPAVSVDADGETRFYVLGTDNGVYTSRVAANGANSGFSFYGGHGRGGLSVLNRTT
ncbi:MAG TPA: M20/M25/M40 family metallo-hydrolase [Mycobacteriales bacterium]|nr:M20/M25/M40 family metallo-hydrolase [Mycobacteriales bacterium]